jgi:hypothetical protein
MLSVVCVVSCYTAVTAEPRRLVVVQYVVDNFLDMVGFFFFLDMVGFLGARGVIFLVSIGQ